MSKTLTSPLDEELIKLCISFAQHIAAERAGFDVDPCGNASHIDDSTHVLNARELLTAITETPAKTFDGLQAKAAIVSYILSDDSSLSPDIEITEAEPFFASFAHEVLLLARNETVSWTRTGRRAAGGAE